MTTQERLESLQAKAKRAAELSAEIDLLQRANPYEQGVRVKFFEWNTNNEILSESWLKTVIAEGRRVMIEQRQKLLEEMLRGEPQS